MAQKMIALANINQEEFGPYLSTNLYYHLSLLNISPSSEDNIADYMHGIFYIQEYDTCAILDGKVITLISNREEDTNALLNSASDNSKYLKPTIL